MPPRSALAIPSFRNYLLTRIFSNSAYQVMSVAVAWQVWDITRSAFALGLVGLLQFLPKFVFLPFAGHLHGRRVAGAHLRFDGRQRCR